MTKGRPWEDQPAAVLPSGRIRHERDGAQRSLDAARNAIDVLAAHASAVPDWLPEGAELRVSRPRGARKWRAALYDGGRLVSSTYGRLPSDALLALRGKVTAK